MNNPLRIALAAALVAAALALAHPRPGRRHRPSAPPAAIHGAGDLTASDPTTYHVVGRLCTRTDSLRGRKTVQLLVSG